MRDVATNDFAGSGPCNIGALTIRIRFRHILYYNDDKESNPHNTSGNYLGVSENGGP